MCSAFFWVWEAVYTLPVKGALRHFWDSNLMYAAQSLLFMALHWHSLSQKHSSYSKQSAAASLGTRYLISIKDRQIHSEEDHFFGPPSHSQKLGTQMGKCVLKKYT